MRARLEPVAAMAILAGMEMNGIAHIQLTVNDYAACREFYGRLFAWLEMRVVFDSPQAFYGVGSRTGIAISPSDPEFRSERFQQRRIGLHHFCLRARRREDVDETYAFLTSIGARIVHPPEEGRWAPGYYSVLFEDPDGLRIEVNYVPGKGNLADERVLPLDIERTVGKP
jgi:catechol 2,3-dioxygenase-like lactoylglutathione lyase family enzyme